jgi:hypothetical protein
LQAKRISQKIPSIIEALRGNQEKRTPPSLRADKVSAAIYQYARALCIQNFKFQFSTLKLNNKKASILRGLFRLCTPRNDGKRRLRHTLHNDGLPRRFQRLTMTELVRERNGFVFYSGLLRRKRLAMTEKEGLLRSITQSARNDGLW